MATYSDAASAYAESNHGDQVEGIWYVARDNLRAAVRRAFDAGAAHRSAELLAFAESEPAACCDSVGEPFDHVIDSGWLCEVHTHHTCGSTQPHEPGCGLVPLVNLTELEGWPATPEPVRLTDPDDPRIRDGARVRYQLEATIGQHDDGDTAARWVRSWVRTTDAEVYLLAEAPDPDAELRNVLHDAFSSPNLAEFDDDELDHAIRNLRAAGYDVTKRADS